MGKLTQARVICPLLLVLLMAGHITADVVWQKENVAPYWWDQASYLIISEHMRLAFEQDGIGGFWNEFLNRDQIRSPLVSAMYACTYAVAGDSRYSAQIVNYLSIAVLCLFLYGIGKRLAGPWCGLAAAYVTMAAPMVFALSRQLLVEFPLTAAAAAVVYLCIASDGLRRYGISALLGLAIGIGMMIKITFPAFFIGPLIAAIVIKPRSRDGKEPAFPGLTMFMNLFVIVAVAAVIAGPWLLHNWDDWTKYMKENVGGHLGTIYGGDNGKYIVMLALENLLPIYGFIFVILAALRLVFRGGAAVAPSQRTMALLTTLAGFAVPLAIGIYARNKDPRLIAPAFAALGVLLAYLIVRLSARRTSVVAAGLLLLLAIPFYNISFGTPFDSTRPTSELEARSAVDYSLGRWSAGLTTAPVKQDWKDKEVISFMQKQIPEQFIRDNQVATVVVLGCHPWFQATWFSYLQWHQNAAEGKSSTRIEYSGMPVLEEDASPERFAQEVLKGHFVIFKDSGWQGLSWGTRWLDALIMAVQETRMGELRLFERVDCDIILPDGSKVVVYRQQGMMERKTAEERAQLEKLRTKFLTMVHDAALPSERSAAAQSPAASRGKTVPAHGEILAAYGEQ